MPGVELSDSGFLLVFIHNISMKNLLSVAYSVLMLLQLPVYGQGTGTPGLPEKGVKTVKLTGIVVDAQTDEPVPLATIGVAELGRGAVCDMKGAFSIDIPLSRIASLIVRSVGYESLTLQVSPETKVGLAIKLTKSLLD